MKVLSFSCENFRNISEISISAHPKMNIFYGNNAQGKTNILELIWIFTGQKSFRGSNDRQLIKKDSNFSKLNLIFSDESREQNIKLILEEKKRTITCNGVNQKNNCSLLGKFLAVIFAPIHLEIASEGPAIRRRFLDDAISQMNIKYANYLSQYDKITDQRNSLLKDIKKYPSLEDTLDIWDMQLSKIGTILTIYRNDYINHLKTHCKDIYSGFSDEKLEIFYQSTIYDNVENIDKYTDSNINIYYEKLKQSRQKDLILKYTSVGIHRDDIILSIDNMLLRDFGSQGQQRSVVLSLKLAEAKIIKEITGENPVILFDDVLSELDENRQAYLLNNLDDFQVFITCCDVANTTRHKEGKVFQVKKGNVII